LAGNPTYKGFISPSLKGGKGLVKFTEGVNLLFSVETGSDLSEDLDRNLLEQAMGDQILSGFSCPSANV